MATLICPEDRCIADYQGLDSVFEYTNDDGRLQQYNCGQAAACTFLTFYGKLTADAKRADAIMAAIESAHPPDNFGGWFGTSRRRVERICRANGLRIDHIEDEDDLRKQLAAHKPVIVMLGVSAGRFLNRFDLPGGHWMVAYGYDRDHLYLTNWGRMTWDEFRGGWNALVPWLIGMRRRGLVAAG
jgi:hypothetical protein